jgi:hypothetical protein
MEYLLEDVKKERLAKDLLKDEIKKLKQQNLDLQN